MKKVRVEWTPVGVVGAIVPWNYPAHNIFNPLIAATFAGTINRPCMRATICR